MLFSLLDGRERTAADLALAGEASAQSASGHLANLVANGLLSVRKDGRRRLFRLASPQIAHAIETLASIAPVAPVQSLTQHTTLQRLRVARSCYDHLAGRLGVGITDAMTQRGIIYASPTQYSVTSRGQTFFHELGVDLDAVRACRRDFARQCIDWTERRPHIAGALGAALLGAFLERRWVVRNARDRALTVSVDGREEFKGLFGLELH